VHRAYAKRALMKIPSLEDYEQRIVAKTELAVRTPNDSGAWKFSSVPGEDFLQMRGNSASSPSKPKCPAVPGEYA
jgi:hypothetical protein